MSDSKRPPGGPVTLPRTFHDLRVRPKLFILVNAFFLLVGFAVYFALIPLFEQQLAVAAEREVQILTQAFASETSLATLNPAAYRYQEGTATTLGLRPEGVAWLAARPGDVYRSPDERLFAALPDGRFRSLHLPIASYRDVLRRTRLALFILLGMIYVGAVSLLELVIMPQYVYRPLTLTLQADQAIQSGDRAHELVDETGLPEDEIGEILRSRNTTVRELRRQEDQLAEALAQLECTARDLQRKNALLEAAKQNLAETDRLVSLGLLSASVAHELNTPLAVLHGSIEKLAETVPDPAAQERIARMLRVTQRLRRISESLLDFARVRRTELAPLSTREMVQESWELVGIDEKASQVTFSNEVAEEFWVVGNLDRLIQVFVNLLRNALYAIKTAGHIRVSAERVAGPDGPTVRILVEDDGPGIPPEVLPSMFEAFVSTRLDDRGTGLGLTVAEGIIQQHHGTIAASNRPGGGARLEVTLPAAPAPVETRS